MTESYIAAKRFLEQSLETKEKVQKREKIWVSTEPTASLERSG
jgi:hypothetical protein